jgi:tRNA (cmo5U34)-methyltransferase
MAFAGDHAKNYDSARKRMMPIKGALHLCIEAVLADLPKDARFLLVGAGTGDELFALADMFKDATFTVVEPSPDMMAVCREKAEARGVAARCDFHTGFLDSLQDHGPYDAATSILVSQFCVERGDRIQFFREMATRLKPGGTLITADLSADLESENFKQMWPVWAAFQHGADMPAGMAEKFLAAVGTHLAVATEGEMEELLLESGLNAPVRFFQALMIHAWFARR